MEKAGWHSFGRRRPLWQAQVPSPALTGALVETVALICDHRRVKRFFIIEVPASGSGYDNFGGASVANQRHTRLVREEASGIIVHYGTPGGQRFLPVKPGDAVTMIQVGMHGD